MPRKRRLALIVEQEAVAYQQTLTTLVPDFEFKVCNPQQITANQRPDVLIADPAGALVYINSGGKVDWIQSTWAGVESLVEIARDRRVTLTGIKGIFGTLASQYVFAHLLAEAQMLQSFANQQSKGQWQQRVPDSLSYKTILIVGAGDIGQYIGHVAKQFLMKVLGVSRTGQPLTDFDQVYETSQLRKAIAEADFIVACLPETKETSGLFDKSVLNCCKPSACFINIGRASSVVTKDLVAALTEGQLAHAVLDVLDQEPLDSTSPLWTVPNLTITPHVAAPSSVHVLAPVIAENLKRFINRETLLNEVDLNKGY